MNLKNALSRMESRARNASEVSREELIHIESLSQGYPLCGEACAGPNPRVESVKDANASSAREGLRICGQCALIADINDPAEATPCNNPTELEDERNEEEPILGVSLSTDANNHGFRIKPNAGGFVEGFDAVRLNQFLADIDTEDFLSKNEQ